MLEVKHLTVSYGRKIRALHDVSLSVAPGEIVALIGANGAGKSTLLKTLSGLLWPDQGEILFEGRRVDSVAPHVVAAQGLAHVPEGRRIFPRLTVRENLEMGGFVRTPRERKETLLSALSFFPALRERLDQPGGTLSGGEQQMLAIGRALMARPRLLLLDEPSMGLAPLVVQKIFELIESLNKTGVPILLVEQNAHEALRVASRGYVLETGRVTHAGPSADLRRDPRVTHAYLGG